MDDIDPICGMKGTIPKHGHKFCSQNCIKQYESKNTGKPAEPSTNKLPAQILVTTLIIGLLVSIFYRPFMTYFMSAVLGLLAILKLLDLRGFSDAYRQYDIISKHFRPYSFAYPFIEFSLAIALALQLYLVPIAIILIILMVEGLISIGLEMRSGRTIRCACMGTKINVPLTTLTLVENSIMIIMAILLIL